jgi:hypothetical protein
MSSLTVNPGTGISEGFEALSDHRSASESLAKADAPAIVFLVDVYAGG